MDAEAGDFAGWYAREHGVLVRAMVVVSGDPDVAADAVAEAFSRAYEHWSDVGCLDNAAGWVYRVAVNLVRRRWRRSQLEQVLLRRARSHSSIVVAELVPELWAAIARLPTRKRDAIALRYVAELTTRGACRWRRNGGCSSARIATE